MGAVVDFVETAASVAYAVGSTIVEGISDFFGGTSSDNYQTRASTNAASSKSNADILAELKADVKGETEKKERQIIDDINISMDKLLKILEDVNGQSIGGKTLNINIAEMKSKQEALKKEVVGFIGNFMDDRLVLTDSELSKILAEYDDKKRKKKFGEFYKKLQKQAVDKLRSKIVATVKKQEEMIRNEIQGRLAEVDKNMQAATKAYEEILHLKEGQDKAGMEKKQIQYCYQFDLSDVLLGQLES